MQKEVRLRWLFLANLLNNAGAAFMWPLTTIYMHNYLKQSLTFSGIVLFLMSMAMIAGNYLGGHLFDHWRPYFTALLGGGISTVMLATLIFWHSLWPYAIGLIIVGFGDGISMTVVNAYAATVTTRSNRYVFNMLYLALNVGVVIGTLLVGYLLDLGISVVFIVTTICYLGLMAITISTFNVTPAHRTATATTKAADTTPSNHRQLIWMICLMIFTIYLSYALWESILSVHMTNLGIPFRRYSEVWTINGLLIIVSQPIVSLFNERFKIGTQIGFGITLFALSFLGLVFARQYVDFIIIMVVLTIGEVIGLPIAPAWVDDMAADDQRGKYQGRYNMALSLGRAVGPLFGGMMVAQFSYSLLFITVTVLMLGSLALVLWRARREHLLNG
ncbi:MULTISPECIES: MDR family MFS transporter [Lactiplantibacillus]|mgnify:FL=1|jgi:predicted MFS family arabinose efflux permease|uniref:MFS transporter n=5 Tax=Lactiplantibacillus pentosus TaxID=1589 RepID=A0A241RSJ5_LACPE|nr:MULTISPECIES: MFS transporter [Lactiplantibacillus]MCH4129794.1 MFS transporter [Lactiplantibacillus sp.]CCC17919.1 multidrug transport protein, major facilitator superfamily [Lactiplantibacillus pentosus IG1]BBM22643.1 multidrug transport protein, major facilitator superfamily [Lactiplantibacillus plantarum]ASG80650.1 MFS transporter [Lactiplantibacillus pentosus]AYJ42659.1 MFS transporter [Lactiplantibacillus pentosus]